MTDIDYSRFNDFNEIPEREPTEETENIYYMYYPSFARSIFDDPGISYNSKVDFLNKFLVSYLLSEQLQNLTRNSVFLIINGEYHGIYSTEQDAVDMGYQMGYKGYEIYIIPIHVKKVEEYKEVILNLSRNVEKMYW